MPVTTSKRTPKKEGIRHAEYYNLTETFDELYRKSQEGYIFTDLMSIIASEDNILLAFRNIKRNKGSMTAGTDGKSIADLEVIPAKDFVETVRRKLEWYRPKPVRRVEIPKPNGKMRPLGIPAIWDRVVQQCILQVLDPICEAKFHKRNNGFRPNRSVEQAIAQAMRMMQRQHLHYVVDVDIKGFFDNVNHTKLRKQMWTMGIRDKSLLCVITKMLKAPIEMPDGEIVYPTKGTPQGGVLSPLLANIVLNELDWWIASQWETMPPPPNIKRFYNKNGGENRSYICKVYRKTKLKEMYIVRYADDFKIFCRNKKDADRAFIAVTKWLWDRLKLEISPEKSKVVNLRKSYTEFLGFKLKVVPNKGGYKVRSHMSDKAIEKTKRDLMTKINHLEHPTNRMEVHRLVGEYNSMVIGKHEAYAIATCVYEDMDKIAFGLNRAMRNRFRERLKKKGTIPEGYIKTVYGKSKQMRFLDGYPIIPLAYVRTRNALHLPRAVCNYTPEGRALIHKPLGVSVTVVRELMEEEISDESIEYMDNRISLYAAQHGKCAVLGIPLDKEEIYCHRKIPKSNGGDDRYENLVIVHKDLKAALTMKNPETAKRMLTEIPMDKQKMKKLNKIRKSANFDPIE